jgi:hypothetical protein
LVEEKEAFALHWRRFGSSKVAASIHSSHRNEPEGKLSSDRFGVIILLYVILLYKKWQLQSTPKADATLFLVAHITSVLGIAVDSYSWLGSRPGAC